MQDNFQVQFLDRILSQYNRKGEAVDHLCKLLNVSKDGVYRRLRGETVLSPDELRTLSLTHTISIDQLMAVRGNDVLFTFNPFSNRIGEVGDYVQNLIQLLHQFAMLPKSMVYYASCEIPVFYHSLVPELFSFKLYVWARTVWNLPFYQDSRFHFNLIPADTRLLYPELISSYKAIPSIELWSYNIFDNTLSQIEYHLESKMFDNPADTLVLFDGLERICEHMREMATLGIKYTMDGDPDNGTPFTLYHNEMVYTNNTILYCARELRILFSTFCNPNFIMTKEYRICEFSENWFQTVINKSAQISVQNERQRNRFFDGILRKIDQSRKRVQAILAGE